MLEDLLPPSKPTPNIPYQSLITNLDELKLDDELLHHYINTKTLLSIVQADDSVPVNQIAQVVNSLTAILQHIVKMRQDVHNLERMKEMENIVIEVMKEQPQDVRDLFFDKLERALQL